NRSGRRAGQMTGQVQEVGHGCFVWLRIPGSWGETNIGLITGDGASLLIDTPWDHRLTRSMLEAFEPQSTGAAVAAVLNTHADVDHWWGNALVPQAEVIASVTTAAAMRHEAAPKQMAGMRRLAQLAGGVPGRAGTAGG